MVNRRELFNEATRFLVGGVNSPVRSFKYAGCSPLLIKKGKGAKVYDYDNKAYIDYVLSWGSLILGHAHPLVVADLKHALNDGLSFGATNKREIELAKIIRQAVPFMERIRFVNSGTEAVMGAVRLARGFTGREKIIKFANAYHGHADYLLVKAGSGLKTFGIASSAGVPEDFIKQTIVLPFGNRELIEQVFRKQGRNIAAVLVEPVGGNFGVVAPDAEFLKKLSVLTRRYGALLIFDEVITGFRFHFGAFAQKINIIPDLICLGKIIGGGLPIGAFGGRKEIMQELAPLGKVYQASTFSGNPVVMQAGVSTLKILGRLKSKYAELAGLTRQLVSAFGQQAEMNYFENMFSFKFREKKQFAKFYRAMLEKGVFFAPSEFEANFLSFAHTEKEIQKTAKIMLLVLRRGQDDSGEY